MGDGPTRERFVLALEGLAKSGLTWVVATLRSDFFNRLDQVPALVCLSEGEARYLLLPPTAGEMGQIVRQPAREAGLRFEIDRTTGECLDDTIVAAAASDPVAAAARIPARPALGVAKGMCWVSTPRMGGLEGAIGARAEEVLATQAEDVQAKFPRLLRSLVTVVKASPAATGAMLILRGLHRKADPTTYRCASGFRGAALVADGGEHSCSARGSA